MTLTVPVTDAVLARLRERAAERGTTPEAVAADDLARAAGRPGSFLAKWVGALDLGVTDAADNHDKSIGETLEAERDAAPEAAAADAPSSFLAKWAGAVRSDLPGWADDHDRHLEAAQAANPRCGGDDVRCRARRATISSEARP